LERGVFGIQRTRRLLSGDTPPGRNERPQPMVVDKLPESEAVVAIVGQKRRIGGFGLFKLPQ
jgi:hypothetical protein